MRRLLLLLLSGFVIVRASHNGLLRTSVETVTTTKLSLSLSLSLNCKRRMSAMFREVGYCEKFSRVQLDICRMII